MKTLRVSPSVRIVLLLSILLLLFSTHGCEKNVVAYDEAIAKKSADTVSFVLHPKGKIVYSHIINTKDGLEGSHIAVLDLATGIHRTLLSNTVGSLWNIAVSMDGSTVAYSASRRYPDRRYIGTISTDTTDAAERIVAMDSDTVFYSLPAWMTDGTLTYLRRVGDAVAMIRNGVALPVDPHLAYAKRRFSHNGQFMIYSAQTDTFRTALKRYDLATSATTVIVPSDTGGRVYRNTLQWISPNDSVITFVQEVDYPYYRTSICRVQPSGGGLEIGVTYSGVWSPDGSMIAYIHNHSLYASLPDGTHAIKLSDTWMDDIEWIP